MNGDENMAQIEMTAVGWVESPLTDRSAVPKQGYEGAPDAWLVFEQGALMHCTASRRETSCSCSPGSTEAIATCFRPILATIPPIQSRASSTPARRIGPTRSGCTPVEVVSLEGARMCVRNLEALDGTPIIDLKPVL
jgi:hypothetical protein